MPHGQEIEIFSICASYYELIALNGFLWKWAWFTPSSCRGIKRWICRPKKGNLHQGNFCLHHGSVVHTYEVEARIQARHYWEEFRDVIIVAVFSNLGVSCGMAGQGEDASAMESGGFEVIGSPRRFSQDRRGSRVEETYVSKVLRDKFTPDKNPKVNSSLLLLPTSSIIAQSPDQ